ncbi:MAG: FAD-dependent oxidoreductase [Oleiphilaceae bacterium]|nr:FAD-dependent oxidoreductase [Oleiphilaceae bacterium]
MNRTSIAVIGTGIAGLTSAWLLSRQYDVHLFEASDKPGGHTNTEQVTLGGRVWPVNTGFIVYNDWTYPGFIRLMDELGVTSEVSSMSFSVKSEYNGLEYNGTSLNTLFAQRSNLLNPRFLNLIREILRFNKLSRDDLAAGRIPEQQTLQDYLKQHGFSRYFRDYYIVPMGSAIWSASESAMEAFPVRFFLDFFNNHGMLSVDDRPTWRVLSGGSASYIEKMLPAFGDQLYLNTQVTAVERDPDGVTLHSHRGAERFDQVVMATHSDQALAMLSDPSDDEKRILGALPYQDNDVVLHTDASVLPRNRRAWAAWNYHIPEKANEPVSVTYNMNILQNFQDAPETLCVTLNRTHAIDPDRIIKRFRYAHPSFTLEGIKAQQQYDQIGAVNRTHYCGAYWFNGFHEDGVQSALRVTRSLGIDW